MKYDIIVIGAGSAGLNVASFMNRIGLKVLLVEKKLIGGDCLNYGCVPSKALISLAKSVAYGKKTSAFGLKLTGKVDLSKIAKLISARQDKIRVHENPSYFRKKGIDVIMGNPKFVSKDTIVIDGKEHSARKIVIATGSRPRIPDIPGLDKSGYMTNETLFMNKKLPSKLLVIGGGPIGTEIAQAYQRLGSKVTVVEKGDQFLPKEEKDIASDLHSVLAKEGMNQLFGCKTIKFAGKSLIVNQKGKNITIPFDQVLIAIGRVPNVEGLDLEKAGVSLNERGGLVVDKYLRTTNKKIFACGDVAGSFQFTHWAEYQASLVINNMLSPFKKSPQNEKIAWVTYTDPEIATFGLQIGEILGKKIPYSKVEMKLASEDRAIVEGITIGKLKLYLDKKGLILGGTMLAKDAGELSGELISAMTLRIPISKLFDRIYPYPTMSRITRRAVADYLGRKLTPRSMGFLRRMFKFL